MAKRSLLVALLALVYTSAAAQSAPAKGLEMGARNGVTVSGSPYRYVAISAHVSPKLTLVEQIDRRDGRVQRWWQLPGDYGVPAVAYDGTGGGLSADGKTLVLGRFPADNPPVYPPTRTQLAILDTELPPRRPPGDRPDPTPSFSSISLAGHFAFDAISPDGSTIYLIHYLQRRPDANYLTDYEVRALDVESRRLLPEPVVDPDEPEERMAGLPMTRATSPDGRWAYTFYYSPETGKGRAVRTHEPFIHALDTVAGQAVCIDLPQLTDFPSRFLYLLQLETRQGGRELILWRRVPGPAKRRELLTVNTRSFAVHEPGPVATASSGVGPWPPIAVLGAGAMLLAAWLGLRRRADAEPTQQE